MQRTTVQDMGQEQLGSFSASASQVAGSFGGAAGKKEDFAFVGMFQRLELVALGAQISDCKFAFIVLVLRHMCRWFRRLLYSGSRTGQSCFANETDYMTALMAQLSEWVGMSMDQDASHRPLFGSRVCWDSARRRDAIQEGHMRAIQQGRARTREGVGGR